MLESLLKPFLSEDKLKGMAKALQTKLTSYPLQANEQTPVIMLKTDGEKMELLIICMKVDQGKLMFSRVLDKTSISDLITGK